jgi:hypothetical protein
MRHSVLSLLVVGLFVGVGPLVTAQNVAAGAQPMAIADSTTQKPTRQTRLSTAAIDRSKETDYKAAKAKAQTEYNNAIAKCHKRSSKAKPACMTEAKAVRIEALAQAKTRWENQQ